MTVFYVTHFGQSTHITNYAYIKICKCRYLRKLHSLRLHRKKLDYWINMSKKFPWNHRSITSMHRKFLVACWYLSFKWLHYTSIARGMYVYKRYMILLLIYHQHMTNLIPIIAATLLKKHSVFIRCCFHIKFETRRYFLLLVIE